MKNTPHITVLNWGSMPYQQAWDKQEALLQTQLAHKKNGNPTQNYLIFVEHPNVYTLGKSGNESNVLLTQTELAEQGIGYYKTNRGGDITYHGPGQIVGYPIIDLENFKPDIGWYLRSMEQAIINTLAHYNIVGERSPGETGVWLQPNVAGRARKICAIGVRCSRWVTMHGFALNVNTNLSYFNHIIPCGIQLKSVTSMQAELGQEVEIETVRAQIAEAFIAAMQ